MSLLVTINSITGQSPYNIYICQPDGSGCFYIDNTTTLPFDFTIPYPYDNLNQYMIKIIDNNDCVITGTTIVL